jgi:dienelactone hydrolase
MRGFLFLLAACGSTTEPMPSPEPDGSMPLPDPVRRCTVTDEAVSCSYDTHALGLRDVHVALPAGDAPVGGWPTVIYYQGSFVSAEQAFAAEAGATFGAYHLGLAVANLLDAGFAVVAPEALGNGSTAWGTNVPPTHLLWDGSADDRLVRALLAAIEDGTFGPLDGSRLSAMGISSGGFMTSRMAVSYPGRFRSLAIHSGSYATCSTICVLPEELPADHPPTLFLIGAEDAAVPLQVMTDYRDQLQAEGHVVSSIVKPAAGHEWIPEAATAIRDWFLTP